MGLWWLSFVDPKRPQGQRFLGCALVETETDPDDPKVAMSDAIRRAWRTGCNPGGEVQASQFDLDRMSNAARLLLARAPHHVLMDRDTMREYGLE